MNPVELHKMYYGIRLQGHTFCCAAFAYLPDAQVLLRHLAFITQGGVSIYELVSLTDGVIIARTSDPQ